MIAAHPILRERISPPKLRPEVSRFAMVSAVVETKVLDGHLGVALNGPTALGFRSQLRIEEDSVCRRCVCSLYRGGSPRTVVTNGEGQS